MWISSADVNDREGLWDLLEQYHHEYPRLKHLWVDQGYQGVASDVLDVYGFSVDIVSRDPHQPGWQLLPRRWVVERTLAWLGRYRVLSKEYTSCVVYTESLIYLASIHRMVRKVHRNPHERIPYENRTMPRKRVA